MRSFQVKDLIKGNIYKIEIMNEETSWHVKHKIFDLTNILPQRIVLYSSANEDRKEIKVNNE